MNYNNEEFISKRELIRHLRFLYGTNDKTINGIYKEITNFVSISKLK